MICRNAEFMTPYSHGLVEKPPLGLVEKPPLGLVEKPPLGLVKR